VSLYLLDTNIVSDFIDDTFGKVGQRLALLRSDDVAVSVVVAAELRFGAEKRRSGTLAADIETSSRAGTVEPLKPPVDGSTPAFDPPRADPATARRQRPPHRRPRDHLDRILVSGDRAFERVPGLRLENWLA
jgi:tRNA(fMet)-specific endonuclease VapC